MIDNSYDLIEMSSEEEKYDNSNSNYDNTDTDNTDDTNNTDSDNQIILIQNDDINIDDEVIMDFINFCIINNIFDNTFYDYGNAFSIVATKLPRMFEKISDDYKYVTRDKFINIFKTKYKFEGDIEYVYDYIEKNNKEFITIDELLDFFLAFVKYTTF